MNSNSTSSSNSNSNSTSSSNSGSNSSSNNGPKNMMGGRRRSMKKHGGKRNNMMGGRRRSMKKHGGSRNNMMGGSMVTVGTKAQVYHGTAKHTSGGLKKHDLMKTKKGRIVSRKKHAAGKKAIKRLIKLGFKAKKGKFKLFKK